MSELIQIEEIAQVRQGRYTSPSELSATPTGEAKVPVWGANGILGYTQKATYEEAQPLVTCRGNGCGLIQWSGGRAHISNNAMAILPKEESRDSSKYLYYSLLQSDFSDVTTGSAQPQITMGHLNKKEIYWHSDPNERAQIAHILGTLDDKIELNRKTNETLEAMARALFKSWFVDFDPVRAKAEGRSTDLPDAISDLFPDYFEESELGEIPGGWVTASLRDFIALDSGLPYKGSLKGVGDACLLTMGCADRSLRFKNDGVHAYPSTIPSRHLVEPGDIVICSHDLTQAREQLGAPFVVPEHFAGRRIAAATNTFIVRGVSTKTSEYLYQVFRSAGFRDQMIASAKGSVILHVSKESVLNYLLPAPKSELLFGAYQDVTNGITKKIQENTKSVLALAIMRDALLPKLISGELRIPDPERLLEEAGV
jgi:type I restriction enzyme S subunit